jgi:hypothetical protein
VFVPGSAVPSGLTVAGGCHNAHRIARWAHFAHRRPDSALDPPSVARLSTARWRAAGSLSAAAYPAVI